MVAVVANIRSMVAFKSTILGLSGYKEEMERRVVEGGDETRRYAEDVFVKR